MKDDLNQGQTWEERQFDSGSDNRIVREAQAGSQASTGAAAGAVPARDLSPDEEKTIMNLFKIVNGKLSDLVKPVTLSYNEQEVTVLSLHWNGIHCRNEQGEALIVPGEWQYLREIFVELE